MTADPIGLIELAGRRPLRIADLPSDTHGVRYELIDGGLYVTPLGDYEHQVLVGAVHLALAARAPQGLVALPGVNVIGDDRTIIQPDVAVVNPTHLAYDGLGVSPTGVVLAVEITSPSTRRRDLTIKRDLYREWGVPLLLVDRTTTPPVRSAHGALPSWSADLLDTTTGEPPADDG